MRITENKLRSVIREVIKEAIGGRAAASARIESAFLNFVDAHPELTDDPDFMAALQDRDYMATYDDMSRTTQLVLGTIISGGGDKMYKIVEKMGLLPELQRAIAGLAKKVAVIPYSEYHWNEDVWGADL